MSANKPSSFWGWSLSSVLYLLTLKEEKETRHHSYHLVSQWVSVKDETTGTTGLEMRLQEGRPASWDFNGAPSVLTAYSGYILSLSSVEAWPVCNSSGSLL